MSSVVGDVSNVANLTPEYIAYTNASRLLAQTGALYGAVVIVVLLRCYVRTALLKSFGKDDWTMVLAFAFATATFITYAMQIKFGMGKHLVVIQSDKEAYREFLRLRQVQSILGGIGVALVKVSVAFFLLRLVTRKAHVWFLYGLGTFMVLFTTACMGTLVSSSSCVHSPELPRSLRASLTTPYLQIFQCTPVAAAWDLSLRPPPQGSGTAKCFSPQTFTSIGLMNTIVTIATDFLLALLPVPLIWQLHLNLRAKLSLILVLGLGLFAGIAAVIKSQAQTTFFANPDPYVHDTFTMWRFIEYDVGIIAASLPALKPLFSRFLDATRGMTSARTRGSSFQQDPLSLGYQKQAERSDKGIVLKEYAAGSDQSARSSVRQMDMEDGNVWNLDRAKDSSDCILPLHDVKIRPGVMVVTRGVHVK